MSGYSRKGRRVKATMPNTISNRASTDAKTGRLTEMSESNTG